MCFSYRLKYQLDISACFTVLPIQLVGYDGSAAGGVATGYTDYNRGAGDFSGRGADFGTGYTDRGAYGQNVGSAAMGYTSTAPGMGGGYGPATGAVGGYGPTGTADYGRTDYSRAADFGARTDYGNYHSGCFIYSGLRNTRN